MTTNYQNNETVSDELATSELSMEDIEQVDGGGKGQLIWRGVKAVGRSARDAAAWLGISSLFD